MSYNFLTGVLLNKIYYCNIENFGDKLNEYIFEKIVQKPFTYSSLNEANFIGIGSILDKLIYKPIDNFTKIFQKKQSIIILSSGFSNEEAYYVNKARYFKPLTLNKQIDCKIIRGRYSLNLLNKILETNVKYPIIGDGGLLAKFLIDKSKIDVKYDLGIIPHYAEANENIFKEILQKISNSVILDTTQKPLDFLKDLAECKTIISTAMHPLIACDALNIPNLWIRYLDKTTTKFKFNDYYSIFELEKKPVYLKDIINIIDKDFTDDIIKNYDIDYKLVEKTQKKLISEIKSIF